MKVKFDKDALLKHRFWIIASVTAVLTLFGITYLVLYGSEDARKRRSELKGTLAGANIKAENNQETNEAMAKHAKEGQDAAAKVWADAYNQQAADFVWPAKIEEKYDFLNGLFASDIKVGKAGVDRKEWPADSEFLMHGILVAGESEWMKVRKRKAEKKEKDKDKEGKEEKAPKEEPLEEVTLYRMEGMGLTSEDNQRISWDRLVRDEKDKLLTIRYQSGMYFGDLLTLPERDLFQKTYKTQHDEILTRVDPVDESGAGVLQLRNWLFRRGTLGMDPKEKGAETSKKFYRHVTKDWNTNEVPVPIFSAEAWIAQENVWIQREIFRLIKGVNDDISVFRPIVEWPVDKNAKTFDQDLARGEKKNFAYRFQNVNFEVSLTLEANDTLKFKISNLLPRKQKLDLRFRILMNEQLKDARYDRSKSDLEQSVFRISGEALTPKGEAGSVIESEIPFTKEKELDRRGIYGIEQILTWETAAIKRLDNVSIGSNDVGDFSSSHREYVTPLRSLEGEPKEASGGGGNAGNKTKLQHDLWTDRYLDVTEQSRRIPVAVAMIVDQDHVNRVLTHFNNSKYRYFHSQVLLNHYSGSLLPTIKADPQREGAAPPAAGGPMGMPMGGGGAGAGGGQEHETNMELIIYGVMTLYQRYPPRPAPEKKQ